MLHFRKLPGRILIVALALLLLCSSVLAVGVMPRSTGSDTKNGVYLQIGASGVSWEAATYVLCNEAEFVSTTVTVLYNGVPLTSNTDSGVREAIAEVQSPRGDAIAQGTCYATVNGSNCTGPTLYARFT